jgi:hypothetical protein
LGCGKQEGDIEERTQGRGQMKRTKFCWKRKEQLTVENGKVTGEKYARE